MDQCKDVCTGRRNVYIRRPEFIFLLTTRICGSMQRCLHRSKKCLHQKTRVYIFVDNLNLWINAKMSAQVEEMSTSEDHRIRVDLGQLAKFIQGPTGWLANRQIVDLNLFGSKPPPADSVWELAAEQGWQVIVSDRSACTGAEKMVDCQMTTKIAEVCRCERSDRSCFWRSRLFTCGSCNCL